MRFFYVNILKRFFDIIFSGLALILLSPLFLIIVLLIKTKLGSPVIFKQERPGKNNQVFSMYKFRTMSDERDLNGYLLPDSERLSKFGKVLRSTSLDELPELLNILKGDMSIVGPRPQLVKDLWYMDERVQKRHNVLPGLTGWAQVNGRNNITWDEKFNFDLEYIEKISLLFDIKIIFITIKKVLKRSDIDTEGFETGEDYGDYLYRIKKISEFEYNKILKDNCNE
ncbi:sugar transferase [Vagococcus silagei]|uniref:Sugar transferase n=1 Tax=Vagococcus silagei TaxID=2508885 RepID=A0A4S3AZE4_9ENTE|nr:sugar transferase [Vagococcus silagei]THB60164.1 sugar transferase [Vagococcus silagei]